MTAQAQALSADGPLLLPRGPPWTVRRMGSLRRNGCRLIERVGCAGARGGLVLTRWAFMWVVTVPTPSKTHDLRWARRLSRDAANTAFRIGHATGSAGGMSGRHLPEVVCGISVAFGTRRTLAFLALQRDEAREGFSMTRRGSPGNGINAHVEHGPPLPSEICLASVTIGESQVAESKSLMLCGCKPTRKNHAFGYAQLVGIVELVNPDGHTTHDEVSDCRQTLCIGHNFKPEGRCGGRNTPPVACGRSDDARRRGCPERPAFACWHQRQNNCRDRCQGRQPRVPGPGQRWRVCRAARLVKQVARHKTNRRAHSGAVTGRVNGMAWIEWRGRWGRPDRSAPIQRRAALPVAGPEHPRGLCTMVFPKATLGVGCDNMHSPPSCYPAPATWSDSGEAQALRKRQRSDARL